jgi:hypothetical protein
LYRISRESQSDPHQLCFQICYGNCILYAYLNTNVKTNIIISISPSPVFLTTIDIFLFFYLYITYEVIKIHKSDHSQNISRYYKSTEIGKHEPLDIPGHN